MLRTRATVVFMWCGMLLTIVLGVAAAGEHKLELSVNLKTAQALGLTMPPSLLFQADEGMR